MKRARLAAAAAVVVAVPSLNLLFSAPDSPITIVNAQPACQFVVSPTRIELGFSTGSGTIQVETQAGCAWTATVDVDWTLITSGASGTGPGTISYSVPTTIVPGDVARQAAIKVRGTSPGAGQDVLVTQGASCDGFFWPAPGPTSPLTFGGAGGGGRMQVFPLPSWARWQVHDAPDWITPTSPALGVLSSSRDGAFFAVSPNPSTEPRVGELTFCTQKFQIRQSGRSLRAGGFVPGDFDDDGRADPAVYRPSNGTWYVLPSGQNYNAAAGQSYQWGLAGDIPIAGDFDGDKKAELAVYRPNGFDGTGPAGTWYTRYSSDSYGMGTPTAYPWATGPMHALENRPLVADFSGDGKTDLVLYRPSVGRWHIQFASASAPGGIGTLTDMQWGLAGDIPVPADYDGDGRADLAVWRPQSGEWYLRFSQSDYTTAAVHQWGLPGDVPQVSDFDGDGRADLTVYRPSNGVWYVKHSSTSYSEPLHAEYQWGMPGDQPMANDYDGDGKTDLAIWRPSAGVWYIRDSSANFGPNAWRAYQWGLPGDIPLGQR